MVFALLALVAAGIVPRYYTSMTGAAADMQAAPPEVPGAPQTSTSGAYYRSMTISRGANVEHRDGRLVLEK